MKEDWASKYRIRESNMSGAEADAVLVAALAALALAVIAVPALIVWWLVESGLFGGVALLAGVIVLLFWACSLIVRIFCCSCH